MRLRLWDEEGHLGYSAPEGTLTPELLAELREHKGEILRYLRLATQGDGQAAIGRRPVAAIVPVSMAQRRLWFIAQLEQASIAYNMPVVLDVSGPLDRVALARSISEIVRRHESLRTTFRLTPAGPVQDIHEPTDLPLPVRDLRSTPPVERDAEARRIIDDEVHAPFDLEAGPLIRCTLLSIDIDYYIFILIIHHIVADGWSLGVFLRELAVFYGAHAGGGRPPLRELSIQYADFSEWQWAHCGEDELGRHLAYWRDKLADLPPLRLPTDRPRPPVESFRGSHHPVRLRPDLTASLKELSRREGVTLYMTLLAAFNVLLARHCDRYDVAVASGTANRSRREVEDLIGFFVNAAGRPHGSLGESHVSGAAAAGPGRPDGGLGAREPTVRARGGRTPARAEPQL